MNTKNFLQKDFWIVVITILFVIANGFAIYTENYFLSIIPFGLLVFYLSFVSLDKLIYFVVFFVPISLPLENYAPQLGFNLQLPTEPILAYVMLLFLYRLILEKEFNYKIIVHPVSIAILINLGVILFTSFTSTMPLVSFKVFISRVCFLIAFYFIATQMFVNKQAMRKYVWAFVPLMLVVIFYAIVHLSQYGLFNQQKAHLAASPFFRDHTSYGAILAMLFPFAIGFAVTKRYSAQFRMLCWLLVAILCFALLLSYTRAAWIGLIVAIGVFVVFELKINWGYIIVFTGILGSLFFMYKTEIYLELSRNRQDSSKDLMKHIQSMSNISTDESNLERLNRWSSAKRMIIEKPFLGWGPGTFMFQYAPYQISHEKTSISTNRGDMGNAHSEFIGSFVESGILGLISFVSILLMTMITAFKIYQKSKGNLQLKIIILSASLGLVTYYTHAFLNNFLDMDKAAVLFWGFTAMIVAMDVYEIE